MNGLLTFEDLCQLTGYTKPGQLAASLRKQGVHVFFGKGGKPWTTIDLLNRAGGLRPASNDDHYPAEAFR